MRSFCLVDIPQSSMVGPQRQQISELQFDKFPYWKIRFKKQVTTCSDFPSDAMLWIKEVEMVDSFEELKSSRSACGKDFPNFEMLDAEIASVLNKIIQNSQFKKKVSLEEQKAPKEDRFLRGRHIAFMIYDYFRVTGAHDTVLDHADSFSITLRNDNVQDFDTRWDDILFFKTKIPTDDVLESLYKLRIRWSDQLKTVLELYDVEIHQKISMLNYQKLKTVVKRSIDQKLPLRNFVDARHEKIETGAVVKSHRGLSGVERGEGGISHQWKEKGHCSKGDQCSFLHENNDRAPKPTPKAATLSEPSMTRGRSVSRKRNARGRSQFEKFNRPPCKYFLKGTCTKSHCEYWHPPECQFYKTKSGRKFDAECSFPHWKVEEQPNEPKKGDDKSAVAIVQSVRQLGCVSQDTELPDSASISRKGTRSDEYDSQGLHCVKQTSEKIKVRRLVQIQVKFLHQPSPYAMKFEDRSPEEIARQEQCALGDAWETCQENL